jgi:hypothetical protein
MLLQFPSHGSEVDAFVMGEGVPVSVHAGTSDTEALGNLPEAETGGTGQLDLVALGMRGDAALATWLLESVVRHARGLRRITGSGWPARLKAPMACRGPVQDGLDIPTLREMLSRIKWTEEAIHRLMMRTDQCGSSLP